MILLSRLVCLSVVWCDCYVLFDVCGVVFIEWLGFVLWPMPSSAPVTEMRHWRSLFQMNKKVWKHVGLDVDSLHKAQEKVWIDVDASAHSHIWCEPRAHRIFHWSASCFCNTMGVHVCVRRRTLTHEGFAFSLIWTSVYHSREMPLLALMSYSIRSTFCKIHEVHSTSLAHCKMYEKVKHFVCHRT